MKKLLLVLVTAFVYSEEERNKKRSWSIGHYGALPNKEKYGKQNGAALGQALMSALPGGTVIVPKNHTWYIVPQMICQGIANNVTLQIDGVLAASTRIDEWPLDWGGNDYMPLLKVTKSFGFRITGQGAIDGKGNKWWWAFLLGELEFKRPILLEIDESQNVQISNLAIFDAPRFNIFLGTYTQGALLQNLTIIVNWRAQLDMIDSVKKYQQNLFKRGSLPMFPFNTDGIDVAGIDIIIENCTVSNFDDVIAIKPAERKYEMTHLPNSLNDWKWCSKNITVRNIITLYGAGISVGSVHPSNLLPCIHDVTFNDAKLYYPIKGVYIKPDLRTCEENDLPCAAFISNVTYSDITIYQGQKPAWWDDYEKIQRSRGLEESFQPNNLLNYIDDNSLHCGNYNFFCMMWPLYLGTQQQLEPDGVGSGIWPQTEPLVTVANISLINISASGGNWPETPAALRCNISNPCTGIHLENIDIQAEHFLKGERFICSEFGTIYGTIHGFVSPNATDCILSSSVPVI